MAVESGADRAAFFSSDDFGVSVTYTKAGGSAVAVAALWDSPTLEINDGESLSALVTEARFTCVASALPDGSGEGDAVAYGGQSYEVRAIMPDGLGMALVQLERDA